MKSTEQNSRRRTLKIVIGAGILAIAAVVAGTFRIFTGSPETPSSTASTDTTGATSPTMSFAWPRLIATNAKSLQPLKALSFDYPLVGTSNLLVKLGVKADNGVGPDGDIVAFSSLCQHQGCVYNFLPPGATASNPPEGFCGCHNSQFDFVHNGRVIGGPAPFPVPRVMLEYDQATGDIYVVGMGPPTIHGHGPPGTTDPAEVLKYDLQGGQIVTQITLAPSCC